MARKRIGELLLESKLITRDQLEAALAFHRQTGHRIGASLVATGALSETTLVQSLAETLGLGTVDLATVTPEWEALRTLDAPFCEARDLLPLAVEEHRGRGVLRVAMSDPLNVPAVEEIEFRVGLKVVPVLAPLTAIRTAVRRHYRKQFSEGPRTEEDERSGKMTLVRPGGGEEVVHTSTEMQAVQPASPPPPVRPASPPPPVRPASPPPPVQPASTPPPVVADDDDATVIEGKEPGQAKGETTGRTALADLIRRRAEEHARRRRGGKEVGDDLSYLLGIRVSDEAEQLERLELKFWALLRILAKKGIITKDEFANELDKS